MRRGYTLIEMMVAAAIFTIFTTVGSDMLIHAFRFSTAGEERQTAVDASRDLMYRVSEDLRGATAVLDPSAATLMSGGAPYIVLSTPQGIVGYTLQQGTVQRALYEPGYTPGSPSTQAVVPGSVQALTTQPSTIWFSIAPDGGLPPGQGGTTTGPGTGLALALGTQKETIQVQLAVTPPAATSVAMMTKKTLWAGLFPRN